MIPELKTRDVINARVRDVVQRFLKEYGDHIDPAQIEFQPLRLVKKDIPSWFRLELYQPGHTEMSVAGYSKVHLKAPRMTYDAFLAFPELLIADVLSGCQGSSRADFFKAVLRNKCVDSHLVEKFRRAFVRAQLMDEKIN